MKLAFQREIRDVSGDDEMIGVIRMCLEEHDRFYAGGAEAFELYTYYMYEKIFGEDFLRSVGGDRLEKMRLSFYERYRDRTVALKRLTLAQDRFFAELESRRKEYEAIATPALVIAGEEDRVVAPKVQRKITTILPNSRFELIPDTGHVVYLEQPDVFFGMLRGFFARASDRVDPNRVPPSRD